MNIFKIGLVLSVLMFNLSCAIVPEDLVAETSETELNFDSLEEDVNVTEKSFIEFHSIENSQAKDLLSYLESNGFNHELSKEEIALISGEFALSTKQLNEIEKEFNLIQAETPEKEFLKSLVTKLRYEAIQ